MQRLAVLFLALVALPAMNGCAAPIKHGYAYDNHGLPEKDVGVLLGFYGVPSLLVMEVDGRKFEQTFSQPHPVKIFVLPGERMVKVRYIAGHSLDIGLITTSYADGMLTINVAAGHTYRILARPSENKVEFFASDMGEKLQE